MLKIQEEVQGSFEKLTEDKVREAFHVCPEELLLNLQHDGLSNLRSSPGNMYVWIKKFLHDGRIFYFIESITSNLLLLTPDKLSGELSSSLFCGDSVANQLAYKPFINKVYKSDVEDALNMCDTVSLHENLQLYEYEFVVQRGPTEAGTRIKQKGPSYFLFSKKSKFPRIQIFMEYQEDRQLLICKEGQKEIPLPELETIDNGLYDRAAIREALRRCHFNNP